MTISTRHSVLEATNADHVCEQHQLQMERQPVHWCVVCLAVRAAMPVCSDYIPPGGCDSTRSQTTSVLLVQVISDLLKPDKVNLMIREDRRRGVFVDGLSEWVVRSPAEVYGLMMRGAQQVGTSSRMTAWKAALCSCCMQVLCWCCSVLVLAMRLEAD